MVYKYSTTLTTAAGTISGNTKPTHGICRYLYINPATTTTKYKYTIVDDDSQTVISSSWKTGVFRSFTPLILQGIYTLSLVDATANEAFDVKLLVEEL